MSNASFPAHVLLTHISDEGFEWSGDIATARFTRILAEYQSENDQKTDQTEDTVFLSCKIQQDARSEDIYQLFLDSATQIPKICQRCLTVFNQPLAIDVAITLIADETYSKLLSEEEDYLVLQDLENYDFKQGLNVMSILEDELLLSLPISPKHEHCELYIDSVGEFEEAEEEADNPFSVLASLKGKL